ncbi:MAG: GNAT family N-acetyltransferase [Chloroflexi bacterium]|nr:GNAT family N-acetyltransferase [Chloroflexota bacterium]
MQTNSVFEIRPFEASDINAVADLDHSFHTDHVWQMEFQSTPTQIGVTFREVRLPRSMHVEYPQENDVNNGEMDSFSTSFTAENKSDFLGYTSIVLNRAPQTAWITDLAVLRRMRREGIGTALLLRAQKWARKNDCKRILMEMQSKNYPAICLAIKLGFEFSGFSDQYYSNQDIALFFTRRL